jgi:hypothetical protein
MRMQGDHFAMREVAAFGPVIWFRRALGEVATPLERFERLITDALPHRPRSLPALDGRSRDPRIVGAGLAVCSAATRRYAPASPRGLRGGNAPTRRCLRARPHLEFILDRKTAQNDLKPAYSSAGVAAFLPEAARLKEMQKYWPNQPLCDNGGYRIRPCYMGDGGSRP